MNHLCMVDHLATGAEFGPHRRDLMDKGKIDRVCVSDSMSLDVQVA